MSRLMGRLPFKGIYSPFRRPLCPSPRLPCLSSPYSFEARQVLATTYDAITQAEAGYPTRMARIMNRKAQEAREKGEWIDIHDYNPCAPGKYDTIIRNVNDRMLRTEISEILGIPTMPGKWSSAQMAICTATSAIPSSPALFARILERLVGCFLSWTQLPQ